MKEVIIKLDRITNVLWRIAESIMFIGGVLALFKGEYATATAGFVCAIYMRDKKF